MLSIANNLAELMQKMNSKYKEEKQKKDENIKPLKAKFRNFGLGNATLVKFDYTNIETLFRIHIHLTAREPKEKANIRDLEDLEITEDSFSIVNNFAELPIRRDVED